jgi:transposase InsO family protein
MRQLGRRWQRYGYRRVWAPLRQDGWRVNRKRVQRIWREEGLPVPALPPKRRRLGISTVPAGRLRAERPNHVWGPEVMVDATTDGRLGARQPSVLAIWARATFLRLAPVLPYAYDGRIRYQAVSGRRRMGRF